MSIFVAGKLLGRPSVPLGGFTAASKGQMARLFEATI